MKRSDELKQERQTKIDAQVVMIEARDATEKKEFSKDDIVKFRALQKEIEDFDARIKDEEAVEAVQIRANAGKSKPVIVPSTEGPDAEAREWDEKVSSFDVHKAIRSQMSGQRGVDGVEKEVHEELVKRASRAGVAIEGIAFPTPSKRADQQTVTLDSGNYGANLVREDLYPPINFLRPNPMLRQMGATYLSGLSGNVAFPVNKGGIAATWETEVATVAASKNEYQKKTMTPKRLAATVGISLQNLLQSNIDLQRYTVDEINRVVANAIDLAGINGAGSGGVPEGILNATDVGAVIAGTNGLAPTWAHIVGLESEVMNDNYEGQRYGYLINSKTKGKLKTTLHTSGDATYLMSQGNEINGYSVGVTNLMPSDLDKGTSTGVCSAAIFGDFSQLIIGQWGFMDVVVDNITGAKSGIVEITANSFLDMILRHPEAFAHVKDWLTV